MNCCYLHSQNTFLSKIQNCISEKTKRKIVLLSCKYSVKTQFLGVVEFPSIFLISKIQGSGFSFQFLKNYHNLQFFRVILNFAQECYYLKNKVGVVDFTKARGPFGPLGFKTLPILGHLQNLLLPLYF